VKKLNLDTWNRRDHFRFFKQFEEPFFGITTEVDCTTAYAWAKEKDVSFFLCYLHASLKAANETEPFRYRLDGDDVLVHDVVHASPTINRSDGTFGFSYMDYYTRLDDFIREAQKEIERVQNTTGLVPAVSSEAVIHYSSLPWIRFTSLSHARAFSFRDSIPKITFGKMTREQSILKLPVAVHVHHALMDGFHVSQFLERFQQALQDVPGTMGI
jgi:chloramphenicol O-acetyltransferase type A